MKIYRDFGTCRVEIDLTPGELMDAYNEYQRICDREDIMTMADFHDDLSFMESYGITVEKLEEIVDDCAVRYRRYQDENNNWFDNANDAIRDVVIERGLDKVEG